ncbi:hypothetical protein PCANC_23064 [Puccinia coronata f. sp. avenae]|uniref:CUE domain-containing protein n=1 Tax=Puccinia coronata f. sp. avenae TaxID=200324 RepID=A0A2N5SDF0_9BASI|nr:hypothetical protein PCANC_23064 [Puccinia coronata f. sp. avenae]
MEESVEQLNQNLRRVRRLPKELEQPTQTLLTTLITRSASPSNISALQLAVHLNRLGLTLKPPLLIQLIENYLAHNKTLLYQIIDDSLARNHQLKHQLSLHTHVLLHKLATRPEESQASATLLRSIAQSHPSLLESLYQHQKDNSHPFIQLVQLITDHHHCANNEHTRRELLFIIIKVLKDGIIPKLTNATVAFDSTEIRHQLAHLLHSKDTRLLTELHLNYPTLLEELRQLISSPSYHQKSAKNKQDPLLSFFEHQEDYLIFQIYHHSLDKSHGSEFDSIIDQILAVLPHLAGREVLRSIIEKHAEFQDAQEGAQRLIERSFNDPHLISSATLPSRELPQVQNTLALDEILQNRKNIFDDHRMDPKLLRVGKSKLDEREILNDKSHLTEEMKKHIKTRLERIEDEEKATGAEGSALVLYSDDDEEDDYKKVKESRTKAVDIFSDDDHRFNVREGADDSDPEEAAHPSSSSSSSSSTSSSSPSRNPKARSKRARGKAAQPPQAPAPRDQAGVEGWTMDEETLCTFYLADPQVFLPRNRSSKTRLDLKSRLKFSTQDDLIEAWKSMFDRNPKKEEILEKYRGLSAMKKPNNRTFPVAAEGGEKRGRGGMPGRGGARGGRGGRGGDRGRGGGRGGGGGGGPSKGPSGNTELGDSPAGSASRGIKRGQSRPNNSKVLSDRRRIRRA